MKGFFHKRALILGVFTYFVFAVVNKIVPLSYFNDYTFFGNIWKFLIFVILSYTLGLLIVMINFLITHFLKDYRYRK